MPSEASIDADPPIDFVIIGAGSAGCVVANRLSQDPAVRVAVIEGGPSRLDRKHRVLSTVPTGNAALLHSARTNWRNVVTGPQGRLIPAPRGKIDGGSSAVNGMIYMRGHPTDYDDWAANGASGWGWSDVLPRFKAHEDFAEGENAHHAVGGELAVSPPRYVNPLTRSFLHAAGECQIAANTDFNGERQEGAGLYHVTQRNGRRCSSAHAFLDPVRRRPNLEVINDWRVDRITIEDGRATGVVLSRGPQTRFVRARREVIVSAGAINSPHLLMLSGIGPAADLHALGIRVHADLPVGRNFQDHLAVQVAFEDQSRQSHALSLASLPRMAMAVLDYAFRQRGPLASNVVEAGALVRSDPALNRPDLQVIFTPALKDPARVLPVRHGFALIAVLLHPKSRGVLRLVSSRPGDPPSIDSGFLSDERDMATVRRGLGLLQALAAAPALAAHRGASVRPGSDATDVPGQDEYIRRTCATVFHPAGTCRMGDPAAATTVVDPRLRVRGLRGLRVADASIMPTIVSGNTNAPAMMIGERCADFIIREIA